MYRAKQGMFFTPENIQEPAAYDEIVSFGSSWDALKKMNSMQEQQREFIPGFEGMEYMFGGEILDTGCVDAFSLNLGSPLLHTVPPASSTVPVPQRTMIKSVSFSEGMEESMGSQLILPDNFTSYGASWQFTPQSSVSDEPRQSYFEKVQNVTHSKVQTPSSVSSEPPEAEFRSTNDNDEFYERFYNAFNNMGPDPNNNTSESVYNQLIADKPLMKALSKKVKRGYYRCAHCPKMFSSVLDYAKHIDEYKIKREYKCPFLLCPWKILGLPRRPELRRHCAIQHKMEIPCELKSVLKLGDSDFPIMDCPSPYCNKKFYRRDSYARHVSMVHEKMDSRFNKRLARVLMECPYAPPMEQHKNYVIKEMSKPKKKNKLP